MSSSIVNPKALSVVTDSKVNVNHHVDSSDAGIDDLVNATKKIALDSPAITKATRKELVLQKKELDKIFQDSLETQLKAVPKIDMPSLLQVKLYSYQIDGVRWLVHRETNADSVPPFWKQRKFGNQVKWYSSINNRTHPSVPQDVRSSILADEQGLGKTYQSLALVLANPPEGVTYPVTTKPTSPRCTLVVCPVSVINIWYDEINKAVNVDPGNEVLKVAIYEGTDRWRKLLPNLAQDEYDLVLCSYETLASDYKFAMQGGHMPTAIFDIEFHRIILDESHKIRNQATKMFKSVMSIKSERKLCLTGTPFNNHPNDIQSLLAFLKMEPLSDPQVFEERVIDEIILKKEIGLARLRTIMSHLTLRRTKADINMPSDNPDLFVDKTVEVHEVSFKDGQHGKVYDALYNVTRTLLLKLMDLEKEKDRPGIPHFQRIFGLVHYIRVSCCHSELVNDQLLQRVMALAPCIKDDRLDGIATEDLVEHLVTGVKIPKKISTTSPKIEALLSVIAEMKHNEKGVVFSEWTSFLDIIEIQLERAGIPFERIDGSMKREERAAAVSRYEKGSTEQSRVLLCSLKACGMGLNLVRGNHVFIMDPFWNVAAEQQAMDRVHRHGQTRDVRVVRFVMKNSFEDRMLNFQSAKAALGKGSFEMLGPDEKRKARITAIYDLFEVKAEAHSEWDPFIVDDEDMDL